MDDLPITGTNDGQGKFNGRITGLPIREFMALLWGGLMALAIIACASVGIWVLLGKCLKELTR